MKTALELELRDLAGRERLAEGPFDRPAAGIRDHVPIGRPDRLASGPAGKAQSRFVRRRDPPFGIERVEHLPELVVMIEQRREISETEQLHSAMSVIGPAATRGGTQGSSRSRRPHTRFLEARIPPLLGL